jgi:hypothetical protein
MGQPQPLQEASLPLTGEFYDQFVRAQQPVVVRGAAAEWPALKKWTWDYLAEIAGDAQVTVERSADPSFSTEPRQYLLQRRYSTEPLRNVLREIIQGGTHAPPNIYLRYTPLMDLVPNLRQDVIDPSSEIGFPRRMPRALRARFIEGPAGWIGPARTRTHIHFDPHENTNVQILGRKVWRFWSPRDFRALYFGDTRSPRIYFSPVDPDGPLDAFPRFRDAPCWEVTVGPSDFVYIPPGWPHMVLSLEPSVNVSFIWVSRWGARWSLRTIAAGAWHSLRLGYRRPSVAVRP